MNTEHTIEEGTEITVAGETWRAVWVLTWAVAELEYAETELDEEDTEYMTRWKSLYSYCCPVYTDNDEPIEDPFMYDEISGKFGSMSLVWAVVK